MTGACCPPWRQPASSLSSAKASGTTNAGKVLSFPPPHCVSRTRDIPVSQEEEAWLEEGLRHETLQSQEREELENKCVALMEDEDAHWQAQYEEAMLVSDFIRGLEATSSQASQASRVEAPADDSKAAWHASCARRSSGEADDAVEAAYAMIRDGGEGLRKEKIKSGCKARDRVVSFWMKQQERQKGDYNSLRQKYYKLPLEDKVVILEKFLMSEVCAENESLRADCIRQLAKHLFDMAPADARAKGSAASRKANTRPYFINSVGRLMLTWIGAWGRIPMHHLREPLSYQTDIEEVCAILRLHPMVPALWTAILARMDVILDSVLKPYRYTYSLEMCTDTFRSRGEIQLHVHMFIESNDKHFRVEKSVQLELFGVHPNLSLTSEAANLPLTPARGRSANAANAASGHYYLAMPKRGKVFQHIANCEPWKDYNVKVQWITQHWQTCKLSDDAAKAEYVNCKINVEQHVRNVEAQQRIKREEQEKEDASRTQKNIAVFTAAPVLIPEVLTWMETFRSVEMRYRFLVLDGPSCCGKTQFARGLVGPDRCFVADCSGKNHPDLRAFRRKQHTVLLFDEISAARVLEYKKLFQAGNEEVLCGSSPTNQFSYKINVHQTMLIVASNKWSQQLGELSEDDYHWLARNSLHLRIYGPLWCNDANGGRAPPYSVVRPSQR
mgnify:CR=1 FL=1